MNRVTSVFTFALMGIAMAFLTASASAIPIEYGDFGPDYKPGITMYLDVVESSGTDPVPPPKYGEPTLTGDTLDFDPTTFVASATGGDADITDGQLNFTLMVMEANGQVAGGVTSLLITESGDFTLAGAGAASQVIGGVSLDIDILEVDGQPIDPISVFASSTITRDLQNDGPIVLAPWNNGLLVELGPALAENNVNFQFGVTKAEIAIDDQLIAISEPATVAFIAKKDFTIEPGTEPNPEFVIPEPATLASALLLIAAASRLRRV